jgi:hypothetical protein
MIRHLLLTAVIFTSSPVIDTGSLAVKKTNLTYGNWEEVKNTDGVKTYVRWLYYNDGKKTRERKGEIFVDCNMDEAIGILSEPSVTKKWMSGVSENYLITRLTPNQWYTYTLYDIPWPFNKRDLVSGYELNYMPGKKTATIKIFSKADFIPEKTGIDRLINYSANWTVVETSSQKVHIVFSAISDTPPLFPRYIQDPVIEKMFHNNLVRLKDLLSQKTQSI